MTRLTIDLPNDLHKTLKSLAIIDGRTMRNIAISALERYTYLRVTSDNTDSLPEEEIDKLLQPILLKYVKQIEGKDFKGKSWKKLKEEI